jgi:hypothetical protein
MKQRSFEIESEAVWKIFYCSNKVNYILDTNNTKQDLLLTESKQFCENEIANLPSNIDKIIVSESNFIDIPLCDWDK